MAKAYEITNEGRKQTRWFKGWRLTMLALSILKYMKTRKTSTTLCEISEELPPRYRITTLEVIRTINLLVRRGYVGKTDEENIRDLGTEAVEKTAE